jgi:hypothetical protein
MAIDAIRERLTIPLPWAVAIFAVVTVTAFAGSWISGRSPGTVVLVTTLAAVLTAAGLTVLGPMFRTRTFRVLAHLLPGLFVLFVAFLVTALGAAGGALTLSLATVAVLGSLWGLGVILVLAGVLVIVGTPRQLRIVATIGLGVTIVWAVVVGVVLASLLVRIVTVGIDQSLAQDLRDDLIPFLSAFVAIVLIPALVFFQDRRYAEQSVRPRESSSGDGPP